MGGREERPGQTAAQIRSDGKQLQFRRRSSESRPAVAMGSKAAFLALLLLLGTLRAADGKPISLTYRCPCRYFESNVAKSHVKHLKILTVPGCSLQIIARLKNSSKQICVDPKLRWIQEYLEKYLHKRFKM